MMCIWLCNPWLVAYFIIVQSLPLLNHTLVVIRRNWSVLITFDKLLMCLTENMKVMFILLWEIDKNKPFVCSIQREIKKTYISLGFLFPKSTDIFKDFTKLNPREYISIYIASEFDRQLHRTAAEKPAKSQSNWKCKCECQVFETSDNKFDNNASVCSVKRGPFQY